MAKKSVATFRGRQGATLTKVIVPVKNEKTGGYSFKEEMVPNDQIQSFLKERGLK